MLKQMRQKNVHGHAFRTPSFPTYSHTSTHSRANTVHLPHKALAAQDRVSGPTVLPSHADRTAKWIIRQNGVYRK